MVKVPSWAYLCMVKILSDEIGLQPVDNKAVEKMTTTESWP